MVAGLPSADAPNLKVGENERLNFHTMLLCLGFFFLPLLTICACNAATPKENLTTSSPTDSQKTKATDKQNDELRKQIEQIASAAKGRVGVAAEVLETGESSLA